MTRHFWRYAGLIASGLVVALVLVAFPAGERAQAGHDGTDVLHLDQDGGGATDNVEFGETTLTDAGTNSFPTLAVFDPGATRAVAGDSSSGIGIDGGGGFAGVLGHSNNIGVWGASEGTGVLAQSGNGIALKVMGTSEFSRSGAVSIPARASKVVISGVDLTSSSLVLATIQQDASGRWVRAAVPDVAAGSFTILLNKAASRDTLVAWFVVN
jgi:hypothetical protein